MDLEAPGLPDCDYCKFEFPALWRQRQVDLCEFEASLGYIEKPCLGNKKVKLAGQCVLKTQAN